MIKNWFNKVLNIGIKEDTDPLTSRGMRLLNYLVCGTLIIFALNIPFVLLFGYKVEFYVVLFGLPFIALTWHIQSRNHALASIYLFLLVSLIIGFAVWEAVANTRVASIENFYFVEMAVAIFLFENWKKHFFFWLGFIFLLVSKLLTVIYSPVVVESSVYFFTIFNHFGISVFLYLTLLVFKSVLTNYLSEAERHKYTMDSLLDNVPIYMALIDKDENYLTINDSYAKSFGFTKEELLGKNRQHILSKRLKEAYDPLMQKALSGEPVKFLLPTKLEDGTKIMANGKFVPIKDELDEVKSVAIYVDDLTELVETQQALEKANGTKDRLFSIIAHDIKSPLNLFQSIINLSDEGVLTQEQFKEYKKTVNDRLHSLMDTVDELLSWGKMQLGGIKPHPTKINLFSVISNNLLLFQQLLDRKKITLKIDVLDNIEVWIDEDHFKVVLRNLTHNAIKFSKIGATIVVSASQFGDTVKLSVEDYGIGMDQDMVKSILNKEVVKSQTGTDNESGTGIGLSLSAGLLERNNSKMEINSEVGIGTEISLHIPIKEEESVSAD